MAERKCGTSIVEQRLMQERGYHDRHAALERFMRDFVARAGSERTALQQIKVVVHVVYANDAQNISDAQVQSQIDVLNRDYTATNTDRSHTPSPWLGLVGNAGLQFQLATSDPSGRPANGITRTRTTAASFGMDDAVKSSATGGADPWPSDRYLNIWVCNLAGGVLGYAQLPAGPPATDGVVILYQAFGTTGPLQAPFTLGRTATHEVGHWLNLRHIWGDVIGCGGDDLVTDTPPAERPNYGKPAFPHVTCHNGPNGDMFMNYMDYTDDDVMCMFTQGQVARMRATLAGPRMLLVGATSAPAAARTAQWPQWQGFPVEMGRV